MSSEIIPVDVDTTREAEVAVGLGRDRTPLYAASGLISGALIVVSGLLPWVRQGPGSSLRGIEMAAALRGEVDLGTSASRAGLAIVAIMALGVLHLASAAFPARATAIARGLTGVCIGALLILLRRGFGSTVWTIGGDLSALAALISVVGAVVAVGWDRDALPANSADEAATTNEPTWRRPAIIGCVMLAIVGGGALGYAYRYGDGRPGADTPTAAAEKFLGAVNDGDALVLAGSVVPSEAERAGALVASLAERLGVDDLGSWGGSESSLEVSVDVTDMRVTSHTADTAEIEVDGSLRVSGLRLPGPLAVVLGTSIEIDLDRLGPNDPTAETSGLVLTIRREHGRWYVSPLILANHVRDYLLSASSLLVTDQRQSAEELLQDLDFAGATQSYVASSAGRRDAAAGLGPHRPELVSARQLSTRFIDGLPPHS